MFGAVFAIILWFGYLYSSRMEAIIDKLEQNIMQEADYEITWLLGKHSGKSYSSNYPGPAPVHGFGTMLPTLCLE